MATTNAIGKALESDKSQMVRTDRIETLLGRVDMRKRFEEIMGAKAPGFISSVISAVKSNDALKVCDPMSIISSAVVAATLDLPINASLGFAHIVPYSGVAQFQMGWKGFVQLAIRTGQYKTMNASEIYADEIEYWNPITGELKLTPLEDWKQRDSGEGKVVGYVSFFRTINGFEKFLYMTAGQVERHAKKYSKSYQKGNGQWVKDFPSMALKTVLKLLLSKYGLLSIEMQKALRADQAVLDAEGEVADYPDAIDAMAELATESTDPVAPSR